MSQIWSLGGFVIPRSEIWTLRKPKTPSKRLKKRGLCASDLTTMLELNRGEEARGREQMWDYVTSGHVGQLKSYGGRWGRGVLC